MTRTLLAVVFGALISIRAMADGTAEVTGDPVMGKRLFAQCMACHATTADAPQKLGPTLHGIFGRKAAALPDFDYSDALRSSAIVWDGAKLDAFIKHPAKVVPGTKMVFLGVSKDQARADILAYLRQATN